MNRNDIANSVVHSDKVVGAEHLTNRERFHFLCAVFGCSSIALEELFDFDHAIENGDPIVVVASIHLASLQFEYFTRLHLEGMIEDVEYEGVMTFLELSKSKLRWALSFLRFGMEPRPYPFIN